MKINKEKECHKCTEDLIIINKHMQVKKVSNVQRDTNQERCSKCGDSPSCRRDSDIQHQ